MAKVLQIITLSEWGGAQRVCYDLSLFLKDNGFQVEIACSAGGLLLKKAEEKGIKVWPIGELVREISFFKDIKVFFALRRIIKQGKFDIVHCHSNKAGIIGRLAAKTSGVKKIYFTVHCWAFYNSQEYGRLNKVFIFLEKVFSLFCHKIICVSQKVLDDGILHKIADKKKFVLIRNGIDCSLKNSRSSVRQELGFAENDFIFGMVARLAYQKDPLRFLESAYIVGQKYQQAKFVLVGGGPLMEDCLKFAQEKNISDQVFILGEKDPQTTREIMESFDIFVLLSKFEGMPISILEAMALGVGIVADDVGGVREMIDQGEGIILDQEKNKNLTEILFELCHNPEIAKEMGRRALLRQKKDFSLQKMGDGYLQLFLQE